MKICFELPEELVKWLEEFPKQIGMRPDNFIAGVLYRYYDAWRAGREAALIQKKEETKLDLDKILHRFIEIYRKDHTIGIAKHFILWLREKGLDAIDINEEHIEMFLRDYEITHNIARRSYYSYKKTLKKFLAFIKKELSVS
jgi:hypothetical protein